MRAHTHSCMDDRYNAVLYRHTTVTTVKLRSFYTCSHKIKYNIFTHTTVSELMSLEMRVCCVFVCMCISVGVSCQLLWPPSHRPTHTLKQTHTQCLGGNVSPGGFEEKPGLFINKERMRKAE